MYGPAPLPDVNAWVLAPPCGKIAAGACSSHQQKPFLLRSGLVLLRQTEAPGRSILPRDSAHGRASSQDQELSWETRMAVVARNALRPILLSWRACLATLGEVRQCLVILRPCCCRC